MLFRSIFVNLSVFTAAVLAVPAVLDDMSAADLAARSGSHVANVYSDSYCSGTDLGTTIDFGCGGTCHQASSNIYSILLNQEGTGNPKPTADLYSGTNCDGSKVAHAGIFHGEHSGCTNLPAVARSYYLYFDC